MAQYNIQIRTDTHVRDVVEIESADYRALRIEVARYIGELLRDHAGEIWADEHWQIDVTDAKGMILYAMNVTAMETAATMSRPAAGL